MATLVTVLRSGGRYDASWVEKLARGVRAHAPAFRDIVCLTDLDLSLDGVRTLPLHSDWPGWWAKMEAFRPGVAKGTILLCDLDTVLTGPADALASHGAAVMEDHFLKGRASTALMRWEGDQFAHLHASFAADPERWMTPGSCGPVPNSVHGDQVVVDHLMREAGGLPPFLQALHPGLIDFYDPARPDPGPVVVFIGEAKPDKARAPVARAW